MSPSASASASATASQSGSKSPSASPSPSSGDFLNQAIRAAYAAVSGATFYDIYCSTDSDPLWVGRVSEAQRAAGCVIDAVGHVGDVGIGGTTPGAVDIWVVGTGLAAGTVAAVSTALVPPTATPIDASGRENLELDITFSRSGDAVAPALTLVTLVYNDYTGDYAALQVDTLTFGGAAGVFQPLRQRIRVPVHGANQVAVAVAKLAGTGASVDIGAILV